MLAPPRTVLALITLLAAFAQALASPRPAMPRRVEPRVWATLDSLENLRRWDVEDTLASALVRKLEQQAQPDTEDLSRALARVAMSRKGRSLLADGSAVEAMERAIALATGMSGARGAWISWAHTQAGYMWLEMGQADTSLAHVRQALAWADRAGPERDSLVTDARMLEAFADRDAGRWTAARDAFGEAIAAIERRSGAASIQLVVPLAERSAAHRVLGELVEARADAMRAVHVAEPDSARDGRYLEYALSVLGSLERNTGRTAEGVEVLTRVADLARELYGPESVAYWRAVSNLASQLDQLGDEQGARALYEASNVGLASALGPTHRQVLHGRIDLANVLVTLGDSTAAATQLDRADSALAARGDTRGDLVALARVIRSALQLQRGDTRDAQRLALAAAAALEDPSATSGTGTADVAQEIYHTIRGPEDRALCDSVGRVLDTLRVRSPVETTDSWRASLTARADAEARAGDLDAAWTHALAADEVEQRSLQQSCQVLSDRAALLLARQREAPLGVLARLAGGDPGKIRIAWDRLVHQRGLVRQVVEERRDLTGAASGTVIAAHRDWIAARREVAGLAVAGAASSEVPEVRARFDAASARADEAERRWARLAQATGTLPDSASLDAVLATLAPDEAMVAYLEDAPGTQPARMFAFVARAGAAPVRIALGDSDALAEAVRAWTRGLAAPPARGREAAAERRARDDGQVVRRLAWDPVGAAIGPAARVIVVPDGPLADLPWLALPMAGDRYLAEAGPELQVLPAERDRIRGARGTPGSGLLAVGDPAFGSGPQGPDDALARLRGSLPGGCRGGGASLAPLPGAREEAREVSARWPVSEGPAALLLGSDATEAAFRREAPGRRALHLATHGIVRADSCGDAAGTRGVGGVAPLPPPARARRKAAVAAAVPTVPARSESPWAEREVWLALAGANHASDAPSDDDGVLTAGEVATLDLRGVDRVVLSACQSGFTERWAREGVLGMRRAFHLAGVRSVVASQWPVADAATAEWMAAFYGAGDVSTAAALRAACRGVLAARRRAHRTTHPFYWAAFTATGE